MDGSTQRNLAYTAGGLLLTDQNLATSTTYTFVYNAARRLTAVKAGSPIVGQYEYDFQGQRVWRLTAGGGGSQTAYVYDQQGRLLAEHNMLNGAMSREYVWLDDTPIATVYLVSGVPTIAYLHTGQIGEPLAVTSASQALLWNGYVDPFGTGTTFSTPTVTLDMRLPGQWYQAETNSLSQNHWRDYDPSLAATSSPIRWGSAPGQNVYPYVDGNPLNLSDPRGLAAFAPPAGPAWSGRSSGDLSEFQSAKRRWMWLHPLRPCCCSGRYAPIWYVICNAHGGRLARMEPPRAARRPPSNCPPGREDRCAQGRKRFVSRNVPIVGWGEWAEWVSQYPSHGALNSVYTILNCPGGQDWRSCWR